MRLVIAEKPSVGQSIANVIGAKEKKQGYMEGNGYIVSWCFGHLVELYKPDDYSDTWSGNWNYDTLPMIPENWGHKISENSKEQYKVLEQLLNREDVDEVVCATDAGREGELIFRLVYYQAKCNKPMKRLWISSMEDSAILEGFQNLKDGREYDNLYDSALCRSKADWLVGMNGTRLFTVLYHKLLNVGRVQTPTLAMLVEREEKIRNFVKEPFYKAHILCGNIDAVSDKIIEKSKAEEIAGACQNRQALVSSVKKELKSVATPKLYDLTSLQRDANRLFGFTAKQTLEYTQSLYEKKLVTYPRTDSQFLSDDMADTAETVIKVIFKSLSFVPDVIFHPDVKTVLNSKKVTDHHAIIPTKEIEHMDLKALPDAEGKILNLVANRLLCATASRYEYESVKAEFLCQEHLFSAMGTRTVSQGWKEFDNCFKNYFKTKEEKEKEEAALPELQEGMTFDNVESSVSEHFTTPPKHFTEDTLLSAMEKAGAEDMDDEVERKGLGTPATRADVIEKLVSGGFVLRKEKQLLPTEDGIKLITVLPEVVKSPKLTSDWENDLVLVGKGEMDQAIFMGNIEKMVRDLVKTYHSVSEDKKSLFAKEKEILGKCPSCGADVVVGKYGAYCEGKCGMSVGKAMGVQLNNSQVKKLLEGKKILLKGLKSKSGKNYDAYLIPEGIDEYSYTKDGKEIKGKQYKFKLEFPEKSKK